MAILINVNWYFIVILIYISVIISDVENLFMHFLAIFSQPSTHFQSTPFCPASKASKHLCVPYEQSPAFHGLLIIATASPTS